jgi:hypothetical protein
VEQLVYRDWHEADMLTVFRDVRVQGQSGKHLLALSFSGFGPTADMDPFQCYSLVRYDPLS